MHFLPTQNFSEAYFFIQDDLLNSVTASFDNFFHIQIRAGESLCKHQTAAYHTDAIKSCYCQVIRFLKCKKNHTHMHICLDSFIKIWVNYCTCCKKSLVLII